MSGPKFNPRGLLNRLPIRVRWGEGCAPSIAARARGAKRVIQYLERRSIGGSLRGSRGKFGMNRPVLFTIVQSKSVNFVPIVTRVAVSVPVNETSLLPAVS